MSVAGLCVVYIPGWVWSGEVAFLIADVSELTIGSIFIGRSMKYVSGQAKVLTGGGDLREAQVDVPLSVSHSCV